MGSSSESVTPPPSPPYNLAEEVRGMGMVLVSTLISCPDPSAVPEALSLPSTPSQAEEEEAEGAIPLPWEVSLAYPSSRSYLDKYLSDGVVRIAMPGEEGEASTSGRLAYPEIDPKGGPGAKFPLPSLIKALLEDARGQAAKFQIKDPYLLVRPDASHTILSPPPGCTAFYYKAMEMGLRFPLTQFEKDILNAFNLCLGQLSPNSWGGILAVQVICDIIGVKPTLTLWRHLYKLFEMPAGDHEPGWWCFQARRGYRTVLDLPTSQKGFRRGFAFVYYGGEWGIPIVPPSADPNHCLNFKVPELSEDEAVAAIYMQLEAKIVDGGEVFVAGNWLPSCKLFKNEHFLAAFGLSPAFPKEASLSFLKETDQEMAERLTSAALKAARIRAEMKANKINKPSKPKDPSNPKPRKRKERAEERVELTEKALAKARAEKEASAKKARKEPSVEFSIRMTKVAEDRLALVQEVLDLKEAAQSHFDELYQAKEARRLAELRLEEANTKIDKGEATWKQEREDWEVERTNLSLAKENAESAKTAAEAKVTRLEDDLERVKFKLSTAEAQLKEAQAAASRSQEEWFKVWQTSDACTEFCADVGQSSHKMGEDEALTKLRVALADSCPSADWNSVWSRYQELAEAEAAEIRARMAEEASSDEEDDDDDEVAAEAGGSTEPPPEIAAEQPTADLSTKEP
ncbi:uncharacterized protein LOC130592044 [Beta vulgaris subsp. vulgaris]|uniref:uncharacterized protein LOC130592044 n=1 Tax=Beta vulgaris subsp. vulgaris TaxID=3555 RepID=UPI00254780A3|nr:uncharacterized protein LOC130592044 [Beta vulgaris subsp. vulgaris]